MYFKSPSSELSRAQFDSARLGFHALLRRKRMSPHFIERHGEELLQQALLEYAEASGKGVEIYDPPAWIVTCAWRRTGHLLEKHKHRPDQVSYEVVGDRLRSETPDPEETFLAEDRLRKIKEAVDELPDRHRRLIALSYFEGESVREAARLLRITSEAAHRAHKTAKKKIEAHLNVTSLDDIAFEVGLVAWLAAAGERGARHSLPAGAEALLDHAHEGARGLADGVDRAAHGARSMVSHGDTSSLPARLAAEAQSKAAADRGPLRRVADVARRIMPGGPGEAGTFLAGEGGTRIVEVCKGLAVCVVGGGALTGALIGGAHHSRPPQHHAVTRAVAVKVGKRHVEVDRSAFSGEVSTPPKARAASAAPVAATPTRRDDNRSKPRRRGSGSTSGASKTKKAVPVEEAPESEQTSFPDTRYQHVEEQTRDFASTEGPSSSASTSESRGTSTAQSASSASPSASHASTPSAEKQSAEETEVTGQFRGGLGG